MRLHAVLFDLRNTLLKPRRATGIFCTVAKRQGVSVPFQVMNQLLHEVSRQVFLPEEEFHRFLEAKGFRVEPYEADERWMAYYRQVLTRCGLGGKVEAGAEELRRIYMSAERWELYPDVAYAMARLREAGFKLGVVSNWTPRIEEVLEGLGLRAAFDVVVASEIEGYCKPHPRPFLRALELLDLRPEQAVHVGDDLHYDVLGARNAGITPILLDRYDHHPLSTSAKRVRTLGQVLALLVPSIEARDSHGQLGLPLGVTRRAG
jgi:putative hydrolase of the HAD superfamily